MVAAGQISLSDNLKTDGPKPIDALYGCWNNLNDLPFDTLLCRDELLSRIGDACIDCALTPQEMPSAIAELWHYVKLKPVKRTFPVTLLHAALNNAIDELAVSRLRT